MEPEKANTPQQRWYLSNMDLAGQVVADVGANVGRMSQFFFDHGDHATRVVSIEPLPQNLTQLRQRVATANSERWTVQPHAAAVTVTPVRLRPFHTAAEGWNAIALRPDVPSRPDTLEVAGRPLSVLAPDATIVKLDVEGQEWVLLDSMLEQLPDAHTWAIELHQVPGRRLQAFLGGLNAAGVQVFAAGQRPDDPRGAWHNVEITPTLAWAQVPVSKRRLDGSTFKMLHLMGKRRGR
jgi:FkbM family methyltransferase